MTATELKDKPTEKLEAELKGIQIISGALTGILTLLFAVTIYGILTSEDKTVFIALIAVAISCSAILPSQFSSMKKIKAELKTRK